MPKSTARVPPAPLTFTRGLQSARSVLHLLPPPVFFIVIVGYIIGVPQLPPTTPLHLGTTLPAPGLPHPIACAMGMHRRTHILW